MSAAKLVAAVRVQIAVAMAANGKVLMMGNLVMMELKYAPSRSLRPFGVQLVDFER